MRAQLMPFDAFNPVSLIPKLETERLELSAFHERDAAGVFKYASHPQVVHTVSWLAHASEAESLAYIRRTNARVSFERGEVFVAWCIRLKGRNDVLGSVSFTQLAPIRGQIGYVLNYDHWDHGYTREASEAVIAWAFTNLTEIERIQGRCLQHNVGSRRVMEKIGMSFEGVNRAMMKVRGQIYDLACFALTRADWERRKSDGLSGASSESETPGSHV